MRDHASVRRLTEASHNATCWANDVLSLEKELRQGEVNNLVVVLLDAQGSGLQKAVDSAVAMHDAEVDAFVEASRNLPQFGTSVDARLERYVSSLKARMRGVLDWSLETGRYRASAGSCSATAAGGLATGVRRR